MRKFTFPLQFPHVEIHQKMSISACWEIHNFWCISTCGNARSHVNFQMGKGVFPPARIYTYFCVFPHAVIHLKLCKSASAEIHFFSCLMWEFTLNCVSPHAVIHQNLCKSAQRIYTFSSAFPQVEIISVDPHMRKLNFSEFSRLGKFTFSRVYLHQVMHFSS